MRHVLRSLFYFCFVQILYVYTHPVLKNINEEKETNKPNLFNTWKNILSTPCNGDVDAICDLIDVAAPYSEAIASEIIRNAGKGTLLKNESEIPIDGATNVFTDDIVNEHSEKDNPLQERGIDTVDAGITSKDDEHQLVLDDVESSAPNELKNESEIPIDSATNVFTGDIVNEYSDKEKENPIQESGIDTVDGGITSKDDGHQLVHDDVESSAPNELKNESEIPIDGATNVFMDDIVNEHSEKDNPLQERGIDTVHAGITSKDDEHQLVLDDVESSAPNELKNESEIPIDGATNVFTGDIVNEYSDKEKENPIQERGIDTVDGGITSKDDEHQLVHDDVESSAPNELKNESEIPIDSATNVFTGDIVNEYSDKEKENPIQGSGIDTVDGGITSKDDGHQLVHDDVESSAPNELKNESEIPIDGATKVFADDIVNEHSNIEKDNPIQERGIETVDAGITSKVEDHQLVHDDVESSVPNALKNESKIPIDGATNVFTDDIVNEHSHIEKDNPLQKKVIETVDAGITSRVDEHQIVNDDGES